MSERDDQYAGNNLPRTTAEFRAAPDASASTAEFRAFAAGQDRGVGQPDTGTWPEQPWVGEAPSGGSGKTAIIVIGVVVVVAILVAIFLLG
jgi:hypothetical protein